MKTGWRLRREYGHTDEIDCTTADISLDGQDRQTACVNPSLLFAPRTTLYDDEGDSTGTIFIEEYRAGRTNGTAK